MTQMPRGAFLLHAGTRLHRHRVTVARERVHAWLDQVERPYIAFSGGKDSRCLLHLVRSFRPETTAVYIDADCCFPEVSALIDATPDCLRYPADEPFLDTLCRYGLASGAELDRATMQSTVWGPVKRLVAEHGFDGVAYGLRAEENPATRGIHAYSRGGIFRARSGVLTCQPIWDWTYDDVWAYIVSHSLTYASTYDRMWDMPEQAQRVSYWAGETARRWGRYAWLKRNYPDLFYRLAARLPEVRAYV